MKSVACLLTCIALLNGCSRSSSAAPRKAPAATDMQTIDSVDARPAVLQPPPVLTDEGPAPKPKGDVTSPDAPPPPTAEDEALRASLPFAPAIALDPVNGTKISVRANTLTYEYKGRIFYFSGEDSRRQFIANPTEFTKGVFSLPK
jgi:YHS domain-containing protein